MSISRWNRTAMVAAVLLAANAQAAAPAKPASPVARPEQAPGMTFVVMDPVTPEESERAIHARKLPANLNPGVSTAIPVKTTSTAGTAKTASVAPMSAARVTGDAAAAAPASIPELARALFNSPELIYEYVRNNIEYVPIWGVQKGAYGTMLDNQGTSFDQASLMVALLRQSGFTASYVKGGISLTGAQVADWFGLPDACGLNTVIANGQIPSRAATVSSTVPSCPSRNLTSIKLEHVWVKAVIGGTAYYFDPSFKSHTVKAGIDIAAATGYNASAYLSQLQSGASITTDYVQNINRTNIRNNLIG